MREISLKVSVVVPIYNVEKYLVETIESLVNQTLREIEIILVNDGSTDKSLEIIEKYKEKDYRIKTINQKNQGQSVARNKGIEVAKGKYIYFMDSDDLLELKTLENCYIKSEKERLDFLIFDSDIFFENIRLEKKYDNFKNNREKKLEDKITLGIKVLKKLEKNKKFKCSPCTHFINMSYLKNNNLFFYPGIIHEDELFSYKLYLNAERVNYLNCKFFKRRLRENSTMTLPKSEKNIIGYLTVARELKKILEDEKDVEKLKLINIRIINMINNAIEILNLLEVDLQNKYKKKIKSEFKNYFNLKSRIKLNCPSIFKIIKKVKEKVV